MPQRERESTLRFLTGPADINIFGKVHGGAVMKWIDEAGYACAVGWCGQYCVTVYVGGIRFYKPILVGNLVEVHAKLIYTGHTSMHVAVDVCSRDPREQSLVRTTQCIIVFVAIDDEGHPIEVPRWEPVAEEDIILRDYAKKLMDLRQGIEDELQAFNARLAESNA